MNNQKVMHGGTYHPLYKVWINMKSRCFNPNATGYENYGGRGITVCKEWQYDFVNFHRWAIGVGYDPSLTIDRKENDGDYEPGNCRFVSRKYQSLNRRLPHKKTSVFRGVCWHKGAGKWMATVKINRKQTYIGIFESQIEAAEARDNYILFNNLPNKLSGNAE